MGNLTDDMTRLRGEIDALRGARGALMQEMARGTRDLANTVSAMRADFATAHTAMAKKTRKQRGVFLSSMMHEVSSLLNGFSQLRGDMARKGRDDQEIFLLEKRRQVTSLRKKTADDLNGARSAWLGYSLWNPREVPLPKEPKNVETLSRQVAQRGVEGPKARVGKSPVTSMQSRKRKETVWMGEKPVRTGIKVKRGNK